jgi:hypothetical protein
MMRNYVVALAISMLGSAPVFAGPTFESVTFGKQSTRCDASNSGGTIVLEGRGASVFFNKLRAKISEKNPVHDAARCDVTLKLTATLEAPAVILIDVHGVDLWAVRSATVTYWDARNPYVFTGRTMPVWIAFSPS